jgi:hypothetical protein
MATAPSKAAVSAKRAMLASTVRSSIYACIQMQIRWIVVHQAMGSVCKANAGVRAATTVTTAKLSISVSIQSQMPIRWIVGHMGTVSTARARATKGSEVINAKQNWIVA